MGAVRRDGVLSNSQTLPAWNTDPEAPDPCKGNDYACTKVVSKATAQICLNCSGTEGNNEGTNLEIAMMLDVTGSMTGQKIIDLIAAAKDLIDIVVWDDQSQFTSRVALAPFAPAVNVGSEYFALITGRADLEDPDGDGYTYPSSCYKSSGKLKSSCSDNSYQYMAKQARCVVERTGVEQATDTAPTNGESLTFVNVPFTIKVRDDIRLNVNAGALFDTIHDTGHFTWGGGVEWDFRKQWTLIAEVFGLTGNSDEPRMQAGLRYTPTKAVDVDVIYGHNIAGEHASWITAGLTVRFSD